MKLTRKLHSPTYHQQFTQRYTPVQMYLGKSLPMLLLTVGFFLYKISYDNNKNILCIRDTIHEWLYPLNRLMDKDKHSIMLLIGQWFIEIPIVMMNLYWVIKCKNMRFAIVAATFYCIRTVSLHLISLPFPDQMVWRQPVVPSFLVPYDRTRDFYFSGHTGVSILITMQVTKLDFPKWMRYTCYAMLAYLILILLACRVHYLIDIIGGIFFAIFSYDISQKLIYYWDYIFSIPHLLYVKAAICCCTVEDQGNNSLVDDIVTK